MSPARLAFAFRLLCMSASIVVLPTLLGTGCMYTPAGSGDGQPLTGDPSAAGSPAPSDKDLVPADNASPTSVRGDLNADGVLNQTDQDMILAIIEGRSPQNAAADLNADGRVDLLDLGEWLALANASQE